VNYGAKINNMTQMYKSIALSEPLKRAIEEMGYETMTPIQEQAIPVVLAGQDVMGAAQTGTGKTAAFALPLVERLLKHQNPSASPARHSPRALVLLPTRELADQVFQQITLFAKYTQLRTAVVFGGVDIKSQIETLRRGIEIIVATPGRLLDHIEAKSAVLSQVEYVVLDEADRMLDIGFLPDLQRILSHLPKSTRTTLLFSATFSPDIKRLAASYLHNPVTIEVARPNAVATTVEQRFYSVEEDDKRHAVGRILRDSKIGQAFVFVNSKIGCSRLARALERDGFKTTALHGDKSQEERLKALEAFKSGEVDLLVATDVAARGLDIKDVPAVFNFDMPFNPEDYIHRIGRTGRAGASGLAVTLVSRGEQRLVPDLEKLLRQKIQLKTMKLEPERTEHSERFSKERFERSERSDKFDRLRHERFNDGHRYWQYNDTGASRGASRPSRLYGMQQAELPADPFFDQPYQPSKPPAEGAGHEQHSRDPRIARASANMQSKRKIAALFR
jgi:superfamily II DNA/RNA helicase